MGANLSYLGEVRAHWRALTAACIGLGAGLALNNYTSGLFGPHLIKEFGWAKSQYALIGTLAIVLLLILPFAGRLTDRYGVRRVVAIGIIGMPITFMVMSRMTGSFWQFFGITLLQACLGAFTTSSVYSRLVAERFVLARGLAFSMIMTGPPLAGALANPLLGKIIDDYGWRAGYQTLAVVCAVAGVLVLLLIPSSSTGIATNANQASTSASQPAVTGVDVPAVLRSKAFWLIVIGMLLCNLPQALVTSQMKLMAMSSGATSDLATWMMSLYALGILAGRFVFGLSLDRFPSHVVAMIGLGLPGIGFLCLASNYDDAWLLATSSALIGMAQGAEGDVAAYLVVRHFGLKPYSFILGLVNSAIAGAAAVGALMLSISLQSSDSFTPFVVFSGVVSLLGALLFGLIGRPKLSVHT